ncbi:uncharacterized protein LOC143222243 [Tachypleus tridentatus]|uniref:uncharacterized protein LOC143222243 n=1 Tax=Tachypleus tridentatus TaxID=6853 RepID=UPI003FD37FA3
MHSNQQRPYISRGFGFYRTGIKLGRFRISGSSLYVIVFLGMLIFLIGIVMTAIAYSSPYHRGISHYLGPILLVGGGLLLGFGVLLCTLTTRAAQDISVGSEHASASHPMMRSPEHIQVGGVTILPQSCYPARDTYSNMESPYQPTTEPFPPSVVYQVEGHDWQTKGLPSKDESTYPLTAQNSTLFTDNNTQYTRDPLPPYTKKS